MLRVELHYSFEASRHPWHRGISDCLNREQRVDLLGAVAQKARVVVSANVGFLHGIVHGLVALADALGDLCSCQFSQGRVLDGALEGGNGWRVQGREEFLSTALGLVRRQTRERGHGHSLHLHALEAFPGRDEATQSAQVQDVGAFLVHEHVDEGSLSRAEFFVQGGHHGSGHVSLLRDGDGLFERHRVVERLARWQRGIDQYVAGPVEREPLAVLFRTAHVRRKAGRLLSGLHDPDNHGVRQGRLRVSR
mmetsp:Transcript_22341/g.62140  ORF Transcript_22341/g.62140 Transcript_22341/m.62140 type:complete len:250 (-) Transcript_22341:1889-2638(-)